MDLESEIIPSQKACEWWSRYKSIIAFDQSELVQNDAEKN